VLETKPGPIPLFQRLEVESESNCNRSCWFCPRTHDRSGVYLNESGEAQLHQMPTAKILDILDQARGMGFQGPVCFHFYSEPLLDNRCVSLAREARTRGLKPFVHTNGDILRHDPELCRQIETEYEYIVIGIYDYQTAEDLEVHKRSWRERLPHADLRFSYIGNGVRGSAPTMAIPRPAVPPDPRVSIPDLLYANAPCSRPLFRMAIRYDGEMCLCCEDIHSDFRLGNIHESTLRELWYSGQHVKTVQDLLAGRRDVYPLCQRCPLTPTGPSPTGARIRMSRRQATTATPPALSKPSTRS
jgi:radical SAM protein with 4Fe4S-binding SPASM domain